MTNTSGSNTPVWGETAKQTSSYSPLRADISADVCVVGAGIAGLSTAYLLAREGKSVIVLDDGHIGGGETGRTTSPLRPTGKARFGSLLIDVTATGAFVEPDTLVEVVDVQGARVIVKRV